MAKRIDKQAKATPADAAPEGPDLTNELEVLHPEVSFELADKTVVVREYGNVEWLRLLPSTEPLVAEIARQLASAEMPAYEAVLMVVASHADAMLPLIAQAIDQPTEWVEALAPDHFEALLQQWWGVNGRFFVQRAINRVAVARQEQRLRQQVQATTPAGGKSTPS